MSWTKGWSKYFDQPLVGSIIWFYIIDQPMLSIFSHVSYWNWCFYCIEIPIIPYLTLNLLDYRQMNLQYWISNLYHIPILGHPAFHFYCYLCHSTQNYPMWPLWNTAHLALTSRGSIGIFPTQDPLQCLISITMCIPIHTVIPCGLTEIFLRPRNNIVCFL